MKTEIKKLPTTVDQLSDEELHTMCDEIFTWKNETGTLPANSQLKLFATMACANIQTAEELVLNEAGERFQKLVVLLMSERPYKFLNYRISEHKEIM